MLINSERKKMLIYYMEKGSTYQNNVYFNYIREFFIELRKYMDVELCDENIINGVTEKNSYQNLATAKEIFAERA